jgi:hypothetical protein
MASACGAERAQQLVGDGRRSVATTARRTVVPSRVAVAAEWAEWAETIVTDHFTFEPGGRALEHHWLDR